MRAGGAIAIGIGCVLASGAIGSIPSIASADPWKTTVAVTLRKKPGESAAAAGQLAAGTEVVVDRAEGRWLKVHAGNVSGYLTRTTVIDVGAAKTGGSTRAWSTEARADPAQPVVVAPTAAAATTQAETTARAAADADPVAAAPHGLAVRASAAIGYRSLGMDFSSNGTTGLANYLISADASAAAVDVDAAVRTAGRLRFGLDARVAVSRAWNGLDYAGPSNRPDTIPFSTLAADAGVRAGMRVGRAFELAARAGGHYDAFIVGDVDNTAMVAREALYGLTAGGRADIAPPRSRIAATVAIDALVVGARHQTPGLRDGTASTARAIWVAVGFRFRLSRRWALDSAFELGRATTSWSGASQRDGSVTHAHRLDTTQLIHLGVSADL